MDASLRPLGLLRLPDGREPEVRRANPLLALRLRRAVTDPAVTRRLTAPFAVLFSPLVVVPVVLAFGAVAAWVLFSEGLAAATAQAFGNPALFLAIVALTVVGAGFHEFGHAAAARYGGATPGAMGVGFYLFWPAFYTDVTDSYRLGRAGRVRTDLGGLYFNAIVVLLSFGAWWLTGWHAVLLLVATQVLQMIRQLAPLLRFDGYHVLADLTGVPDLYQRIGPILRGLVPGPLAPAGGDRPEDVGARRGDRLGAGRGAADGRLRAAHGAGLPRLLGTAWASLHRQAALLSEAFGDGDILGVLARLLGVVAVVVPVLGIGYVSCGSSGGPPLGVWRRTDGRPVRRGLAVVLAAALVAGLAWAWWPDGDRYRPVRAWEGGTVLDAVPAAPGSAARRRLRGGAGTTVWPEDAGAAAHRGRSGAGLVLVPRRRTAGTARPGRRRCARADVGVPVRPARPPAEGDNQALAVNTTDGSVAYDVSFALVWADGDARSTATRRTPSPAAPAAARSPSPSRSSSSSDRSTSSCRRTSRRR